MNLERLHELETLIAEQQAILVERQEAVRRQQEYVAALMRELELVRRALADEADRLAREAQADLPF